MSLKDDIKSIAFESGCHAVGITTVQPFTEAESVLSERYAAGMLEGSGFNPETIHTYTHPQDPFPLPRFVISVAFSYLTDDMEVGQTDGNPRGWMARFSRGLDYHQNVPLLEFAVRVREHFGRDVFHRLFMDTGSIVDRSAAIRSGLGSRGKNTCVYAGDYGSWVVLGELTVNLDIEPDEPAPLNMCGECNECMKACPTGAIIAPYTVDMRKCLSQVTQSKGIIPREFREKVGTRVYGCDTCQSACPLNKGAKPGNIDAFRPSASFGLGKNPELLPLLNMSKDEFSEKVGRTTAGWIRRTRFRRNVAIALGNIADPIAVPALTEALNDPEPIIRAHAAWALGKIGTKQAHAALEKARGVEPVELVVEEIQSALDTHPPQSGGM